MKEMIYNGAIDHREILEDRVTNDGYRIVRPDRTSSREIGALMGGGE